MLNNNLNVSGQTVSRYIALLGHHLEAAANASMRLVMSASVVHIDETPARGHAPGYRQM